MARLGLSLIAGAGVLAACAVNPVYDKSGFGDYELGRLGLYSNENFYVHILYITMRLYANTFLYFFKYKRV